MIAWMLVEANAEILTVLLILRRIGVTTLVGQ